MRTFSVGMFLVACSGGTDDSVADSTSDATDGDADTDADSDADADTDADTDTTPTGDTGTPGSGLDVLGGGTHDLAYVTITEVVSAGDELLQPSDLAFHPDVPGELWITNREDDSIVIVMDAGEPTQASSRRWSSAGGNHFLAKPASLAFNQVDGTFATAHEEDERTQGIATPADFMGPTLWTGDSAIFQGGDESHLDMLHNSPNATGIAWESDNIYWVFDGYHNSIGRYDFQDDHGLGGTEHSDGIIQRWVEGEVSYVEGCVSHLAFDVASSLLYVADSGNNRIAALDTTTGTEGATYPPAYDTTEQYYWDDAVMTTFIEGTALGMVRPAGLELADGLLWVTDTETSTIWAFDLNGNAIDWLPIGRDPGALAGITVDDEGDVWVTDLSTNSVLRISPL